MSNTIKYKLDDFAEEDDSILIGIIASTPDYSLCWHINKQLNIQLKRLNDVHIELIKKQKKEAAPDLFSNHFETDSRIFSSHHIFKYEDEQLYHDYCLISNKGTRSYLYPHLKQVTYFLEINGSISQNPDALIFELNAIEPIEMAYFIGNESIIKLFQLVV